MATPQGLLGDLTSLQVRWFWLCAEEESTRRVVVACAQDSPKAGTSRDSVLVVDDDPAAPVPNLVVIWLITTTAMSNEVAISDRRDATVDKDLVRAM